MALSAKPDKLVVSPEIFRQLDPLEQTALKIMAKEGRAVIQEAPG